MSSWYIPVKHLHLLTVGTTLLLLLIRVALLQWRNAVPRLLRILPHINDTLLLASGVFLAFAVGHNPAKHPWLAEKLVFVVIYIGVGFIAIRARTSSLRWSAAGTCVLLWCAIALMATSKISLSSWILA